ncbi:MAG: hypothetical protein CMC08_10095 [Flavobacteriaceae bacterium]|nr:hypothetical protein [Flavobacteriaceae bacterium]
MERTILPRQPHPLRSYLRVGRLLYWALLLFIAESYLYGAELYNALRYQGVWAVLFWTLCFLFSFVHIFLVLMDGWSRYQNYKRAKDQLFLHGFRPRIARMYMGSKCQRMAVETAAEELGLKAEIKAYYHKHGVRWYHYVPYFMIAEPLFLFKKHFWSRTFLEKNYTPKYNYRNMPQIHWV